MEALLHKYLCETLPGKRYTILKLTDAFSTVFIAAHPYFPGSRTNSWLLAACTAFSLNGSTNVVPSYHAFH